GKAGLNVARTERSLGQAAATPGNRYSSAMASPNPVNAPAAPPSGTGKQRIAHTSDRRLRVEDILKLMVADGLVGAVEAERLARSRTQRFDHPLELIADQKWRSL